LPIQSERTIGGGDLVVALQVVVLGAIAFDRHFLALSRARSW
jgi:hypothetical protein